MIYFLPGFYIPFGKQEASTAGYFFLMTLLINIYEVIFSLLLAAVSPTPVTASNLLPFVLPILAIVNGVIVPYPTLPQPWKSVYWANPLAYYIRGMAANILQGVSVVCDSADTYIFNPPGGQTCEAYAGAWANASGGYLTNPTAMAQCGFCQYSSGEQFAATLGASYSFRYIAFGALIGFCLVSIVAVYAACEYSPEQSVSTKPGPLTSSSLLFSVWFFRVYGGFSLAPITKAIRAIRKPMAKIGKKKA